MILYLYIDIRWILNRYNLIATENPLCRVWFKEKRCKIMTHAVATYLYWRKLAFQIYLEFY